MNGPRGAGSTGGRSGPSGAATAGGRAGQDRPQTPPYSPVDMEDADPGLARERTELSWTRSSISFAALGIAILKFRPALGVPILLFSVAVWSLRHLPIMRGKPLADSTRLLVVTIAINALAAVALVITLLGYSARGFRL